MQILQNRDELDYQKSINLSNKLMRGINKLMTATGDCCWQTKVTTMVLTHAILFYCFNNILSHQLWQQLKCMLLLVIVDKNAKPINLTFYCSIPLLSKISWKGRVRTNIIKQCHNSRYFVCALHSSCSQVLANLLP